MGNAQLFCRSNHIKYRPANTESPGLFPYIQVLRAFAALGVFVHHFAWYQGKILHGIPDLRYSFFAYGVHLFFAISGFVLWDSPHNPASFFKQRVLRIYPGYFLALSASVLYYAMFLRIIIPMSWQGIILLPSGPKAWASLGIEWTLHYELAFYLFYTAIGLLPASKRKWIPAFWLGIIIVSVFGFQTDKTLFSYHASAFLFPYWYNVLLSSYCFPFVMGALAKQLQHSVKGENFLFSMSLVGLFLLFQTKDMTECNFIAGVSFSLLVLLASNMTYPIGRLANALKVIGDWSYGIYLIHVTVLVIMLEVSHRLNKGDISLLFLIGIFMSALIISIAFGYVERRFFLRVKKTF